MIFGSRAAKFWYPDFREPKGDTDIIQKDHPKSTREIEYHWVPAFDYILENNSNLQYVDPDFLYTIKVSHAAWDIHWDKTMIDIKFFQSKGCKLDKTLYDMLIPEWTVKHHSKRVNLNRPVEEFFKDAVNRKYNHDELHQLLAFYDKPLYTRINPDPSIALSNRALFEELSREDQLKCALEEVYVIAVERYLLNEPKMPIRHAKYKAMKQLITSMTKGWFNLFLIVNFQELYYHNDEKLNSTIKGIIDDHQKRNQ